MTATIDTLRAALPTFEDLVEEETIQIYLDMAERSMGDGYGTRADDAQVFLAAHLMSMAGIGPGAKASEMAGFTNIKAGSLSLTRSEKAAAGEYAASPYGVLFWRLRQSLGGVAMMVTGTGVLPGHYPYPHGQG